MNAKITLAKLARMARAHPDATWELQEEAIRTEMALSALMDAAEAGAVELLRAGKLAVARDLLSAIVACKESTVSVSGLIKGNADLVPAKHTHLGTAEDRL